MEAVVAPAEHEGEKGARRAAALTSGPSATTRGRYGGGSQSRRRCWISRTFQRSWGRLGQVDLHSRIAYGEQEEEGYIVIVEAGCSPGQCQPWGLRFWQKK